ncbi:hypothetical protein PV11_04687 [Exophiala sideris]|uniref:Uncharacterized protein n=1 Tax=Exophiala sideris TaxID=1016849 RepID=A0A0D1YIA2_9EURO|nr:hypothetical protein PV11_04687 [Exophiala sideris]
MSVRREPFESPDSAIYPRPLRPTGLRTRDRTPQSHSRTDQPELHSGSVISSNSARNKASPITPTIVPLFESPNAADRKEKRRGWVGGSSRRLKFPRLREKPSFSKERKKMQFNTDAPPEGKTPRKLIIQSRSGSAAGEVHFPAQRHDSTQRSSPSSSPKDKPLPSLPIATVKFKSPVRRSLIDCQERPLRRSVSPPDGGPAKEEEWPTIQPSKNDAMPVPDHLQSSIKPSLGESFIEGMRGLHLDDKEKENMEQDTKAHLNSSEPPMNHGKVVPGVNSNEAQSVSAIASSRPLSSSQLPKPRDSMIQSLARHNDGPVIRQTKTSKLRLRPSIGKRTWDSGEKERGDHGHLGPIRESLQSPTVPKTSQITAGGPVRSTSRGRLGVTPRGSPYTIPSTLIRRRETAQLHGGPQAHSGHEPAHTIGDTHYLSVPNESKHAHRAPRDTLRRSSIPVPSRMIHPETDLDNFTVASKQQVAPDLPVDVENNTGGGGKPEEGQASSHADGDNANGKKRPSDHVSTADVDVLGVKEVLSTPAPTDDESIVDSDDSGVTVHGYDAFGGFRVKQLGSAHMDRPTLRIADSASRILLGDEAGDNPTAAREISPGIQHKSSAPDLRQTPVNKAEVRRSSAIFTRPLSFARSLTDRSPGPFKKCEEDEDSHGLLGNNKTAAESAPAELPGSDVVWQMRSVLEPKTTLADGETSRRASTEYRSSPACAKGDWPGKDFADLNICPESPTRRQRKEIQCAQTDGVAVKRAASPASVPSRPSTIVSHAPPSKEVAPWLFQNPNEVKAKQEKLLSVAFGNNVDSAGTVVQEAAPSMTFPPRSSSRKPKPPPIVVSPPVPAPSVNIFPQQATKAYGVRPETIQKPNNVKTFAQSVSPNTDSSKAQKVWGKPSYTPSSSSRKVISNLKGLFHKRSTESALHTNSAGSQGSVRRKPVPDNKLANPLTSTESGADPSGPNRLFHYPNRRGTRKAIPNPFISPTTPFTATVPPDPHPEVKSSPVPSAQSPTTPVTPSLSNATTLTHALLDLAHIETDTQRKKHLIQLSKCMVEVVSAARDAEKSMEKAKMEASRAEVGWLKVQKEVATMEGLVNKVLEQCGHK